MDSSKECLELRSALLPRPSLSPSEAASERTVTCGEKIRDWSREKNRKIHVIIVASFFALTIWITLLSLQLTSLRKTNSHADEILDIRKEIAALKGELEDAKIYISYLENDQAGNVESIKKLKDDDTTLMKLSDVFKRTSVKFNEKLNLELDLMKVILNQTALATNNRVNANLSSLIDKIENITSDRETVRLADRVSQIESEIENLQKPEVGDIKYSVLTNDHKGWLVCDGRELSREVYRELYEVLGNLSRRDSLKTTFTLIDARGRSPLGAGKSGELSNRQIGQTGGEEWTHLKEINIPNHFHRLFTENRQFTSSMNFGSKFTISTLTRERTGEDTASHNDAISSAPHNNMPPFVVFNTFIYSGVI